MKFSNQYLDLSLRHVIKFGLFRGIWKIVRTSGKILATPLKLWKLGKRALDNQPGARFSKAPETFSGPQNHFLLFVS